MRCAVPCAAGALLDGNESVTAYPSTPKTGSLLDNVFPPNGTTVSITAFKLPGSQTAIVPNGSPVNVVDPATGRLTGSLVVRPNGTYTFTPAPGFTGPVPTSPYTVTSSDGKAVDSTLDIVVDSVSIRPDMQEMFNVSYEQDHL